MKTFDTAKPYDPEILAHLHAVHIEILNDFKAVCRKYDLPYFALFGTAIGAVRHGGFIPWDDDIDVGMLRADFEKFLQIADKELGDKYFIMSPRTDKHCTSSVVKLMKRGTTFVSAMSKNAKHEQCIFMDIFPFDNVAPNEKERQKQLKVTTFLDRLLYLCGTPYPIIPLKGVVGELAAVVCFTAHYGLKFLHIPPRSIFNQFEKASQKYNSTETEYITGFGQPTALKKMLKRVDMFPLDEVPFESTTIHLLHNNDEELRKVYGDYMQIPPPEKRINHAPEILDFGE